MTKRRFIVALSGGKASAYCANCVVSQFPDDELILYFNDTKWEHPDLYRFINDLSAHWDIPITYDNDGRNPEELFYDQHALANNRMPFCSRILKAERLQKYFQDGDIIIFGIGKDEEHRAERLRQVYINTAIKRGVQCKLCFPLIDGQVSDDDVDQWLLSTGIRQPAMYELGFTHNNCSGGCVRAGKRNWFLLYKTMPEVYAERERVEREFNALNGTNYHFLKDESLTDFRQRIERGDINNCYKYEPKEKECFGVCHTMS